MNGDRDTDSLDALLDAGRREVPSAEARRRALENVSRAARRSSLARGWLWLPAVAALFAIIVVTVGGPPREAMIGPEQARSPRTPAPAESSRAPSAVESSRAPNAVESSPTSPSRAAESVAPQTAAEPSSDPANAGSESSARASRPRRPTPPRAPSLEDELALLDRARTQLARGEPAAALASLDDYDTRMKGAQLSLEAALLRIQALAARGQRGEAAVLAREFVARHPDSPLAERARAFADADADHPR